MARMSPHPAPVRFGSDFQRFTGVIWRTAAAVISMGG